MGRKDHDDNAITGKRNQDYNKSLHKTDLNANP